jgi:hypothetical protein
MKTKKRNQWKIATIVLAGLCILSIANILFDLHRERINEEKRICSIIRATPAWVDSNGFIIDYGVITINQSNKEFSDGLTDTLIKNRIKFVYNSDCGACHLQIQVFGEDNFNKLKQKKLTLDCSEI